MSKTRREAAKAPAKPASYHHGDLRNALVRAAEELLQTADPASLSLRAVARAAGVSAAAPYHHFASKEELLSAVAAEGFRGLVAEMQAESERRGDPHDKMVGIGVAYVRWARANPRVYTLMHGQGRYLHDATPELAAATNASSAVLKDHVSAVAALYPDEDDTLADRIAVAAWGLVHGLAELMADGAVSPGRGEALNSYIEDVLRRGVRALAGPAP